MKKNIKDYLHLYLGCEAIYNGKKIIVCGLNINSDRIQNIINLDTFRIKDIKLILRPLSSMTEEEAREFCIKEGWGENMENIVVTDGAINFKRVIGNLTESCVSRFTRCRPEMFHWLLSKHFDLFNLIPEGLAIDATTLKTEE